LNSIIYLFLNIKLDESMFLEQIAIKNDLVNKSDRMSSITGIYSTYRFVNETEVNTLLNELSFSFYSNQIMATVR